MRNAPAAPGGWRSVLCVCSTTHETPPMDGWMDGSTDARVDDATPKYHQNTDPKNPETAYHQPLYPHLSIKIEIPCITLTGHEPSMYPPRKKKICWRAMHITFFLHRFSLFTRIKSTHHTGARKIARTKNPRIARAHSIGFDDDDDDVDDDVT